MTISDDTYYDEEFDTLNEVAFKLYKDFSFIKQLRYSSR